MKSSTTSLSIEFKIDKLMTNEYDSCHVKIVRKKEIGNQINEEVSTNQKTRINVDVLYQYYNTRTKLIKSY